MEHIGKLEKRLCGPVAIYCGWTSDFEQLQ